MKNYFEEIEAKLKQEIKLENIQIIDNSHKHRGHKSLYLSSISRLNAQKIIMKILSDDLNKKIHALEITIEQ